MILPAFYKLPNLLTADFSTHISYEANIQNLFSNAIITELNSYYNLNPLNSIRVEENYPYSPKNRADLYVELPLPITHSMIEDYGSKPINWIEIKYFSGLARDPKRREKTRNVGLIANDILRLCVFIKEERSTRRINGRYLLLIFNKKPEHYLAFTMNNSEKKRKWLKELMKYEINGIKNITIDLAKEEETVNKKVLKGVDNIKICLKCLTNTFFPLTETATNTEYYGFLINILKFKIWYKEYHVEYDAFSKERWSEEKVDNQHNLAKELANILINAKTLRRSK